LKRPQLRINQIKYLHSQQPVLLFKLGEVLAAVERLRERTSILLVEHKIDLVLHLAERAYVIVNGQIAFAGESAALQRDINLQQRLLGVAT
jgi:branched-chain amino acid transport system ATP-binding protein